MGHVCQRTRPTRKSLNWAHKHNIPIDPFAFCHAQWCALFIFGIHRSSNEWNGMNITAGNWRYGESHRSEWCVKEGKKNAKVRGVCDIDICTLLLLIIYRHYSSIGGVVASTSWMRLAAIGVEFTCVAAIIVPNVFVCSEWINSQPVTTIDSRVHSHLTQSFWSISICVCVAEADHSGSQCQMRERQNTKCCGWKRNTEPSKELYGSLSFIHSRCDWDQ